MKMKKLVVIVLALVLAISCVACLVACDDSAEEAEETVISFSPIAKENIKLGLICLHDENSTYDKNFITAAEQACAKFGITMIKKTGIAESDACYQAACDLVDQGCNIIFADSFGHEQYILKAAKKYPTVRFAHATGTMAHTELQANFYNAFASIYEGRYLAGIAAGMKLNELGETKLGYVGAYTYAEVISGLTSFYLGAKSVCPNVTMDVQFTGSWYDQTAEGEAATALIGRGCKVISQHADSMGAPNACEAAGVPNITYNISTEEACSSTYIIGSRINWAPYFEYLFECTIAGVTAVDFDWVGTLETGSVEILDINDSVAAAGTAAAIETAKQGLINGTIKVFDTTTFTVNGQAVTSYLADVDTDAAYEKDTQVVSGGEFKESEYRSAPYFDMTIDGITFVNTAY